MRPSEALEKHRDEVVAILGRYPVRNPRVFGSVARGEDTEGSDLDIVVDADGRLSLFDLAGMELDLGDLLGCKVAVGTDSSLRHHVAASAKRDMRPIR
jgi:predicted nucleotidyltransferase